MTRCPSGAGGPARTLLALATGLVATVATAQQSRPFALGFTPFPSDVELEAQRLPYETIEAHADLIAHHFDNGVPWPEAAKDLPYPSTVEAELDFRLEMTPPGHALYLAVTPIDTLREGLALYWGELPNQPLPGNWDGRRFDHPRTVEGFLNHCVTMIEAFRPDYFAYAVEVDLLGAKNREGFEDFVVLASQIYPALKALYPELPVFVTLTLAHEAEFEQRLPLYEAVILYTDFIAVSTYPYLAGFEKPKQLPENWFSKIRELDPAKPFAVAETGFLAQKLVLQEFGITIPGNKKRQKQYLELLLGEAAELDAEFVVWFLSADYDPLWELMEEAGVSELFKAWRDTGLWNHRMKPRKSVATWQEWLALPRD